jgi:hypothetical protein
MLAFVALGSRMNEPLSNRSQALRVRTRTGDRFARIDEGFVGPVEPSGGPA